MRNSPIEVRPIAGTIGAEIHGVDVSQDLADATIADIRKALLDHCVIFFRDQKLDAERHKAFTRRFGEIFIHPNYKGLQADPEIVEITATARRHQDRRRGMARRHDHDRRSRRWAPSSTPSKCRPTAATRCFANQYLAYEALSDGMKKMLAPLRALHSDRKVAGPGPA